MNTAANRPRVRGAYDVRYQVKQYVAKVDAAHSSFRVFETGDARWYLFSQVDSND